MKARMNEMNRRRRSAAFSEVVDGDNKSFTLYSGNVADFSLQRLSFEDLKDNSFVDESINGREQDNLNEDTLDEILMSIDKGQFQHCFVVKHDNGRYEFLDGSRRRGAALIKEQGLDCYVTDDKLSVGDKIAFVQHVQTSKEHNAREIGKRIVTFIESEGSNNKEAAVIFKMSEPTVSRHIKAAKVTDALLSVFPDRSEISLKAYAVLHKVDEHLAKKDIAQLDYLEDIDEHIQNILSLNSSLEEKTKLLVNTISENLFGVIKPKNSPVEEFPLAVYGDKNKYAKVVTQGEKTRFELKGINNEKLKEIERLIKEVLEK